MGPKRRFQHKNRSNRNKRPRGPPPQRKSISESEAGITEYITTQKPVFGVLKQRFVDFQVNEIDESGKVLHLTDYLNGDCLASGSPPDSEEKSATETLRAGLEAIAESLGPEDIQLLRSLLVKELGDADVTETSVADVTETSVADVTETSVADATEASAADATEASAPDVTSKETISPPAGNAMPPFVLLQTRIQDKAERTRMHQLIRTHLGSILDSKTQVDDSNESNQRIRVFRKSKMQGKCDASGKVRFHKSPWPAERPDYLHFLLFKENKDTNDVISLISKMGRCKASDFSFVGTKDKRGITVQRFAGYRVSKEQLNSVAAALLRRGKNILFGNCSYADHSLDLGSLGGNRFKITLRNVSIDGVSPGDSNPAEKETKAEISALMETLKTRGFINYYGLQRFGSTAVATHEVGKALLAEDWALAVDLVLRVRDGEQEDATTARRIFSEKGDARAALAALPYYMNSERAILEGLANSSPEDEKRHKKAFQRIPRPMRLMYVHAYQSFVWNTVASKRFQTYGAEKVVPGDIVLVKDESTVQDPDDIFRTKNGRCFKLATEQDIAANRFTADDVHLPLPGYESRYPTHAAGKDLYASILSKSQIDIDNMKRATPEYSLAGDYRRVFEKALDCKWSFHRYSNQTDQIAKTDLDLVDCVVVPETRGSFAALVVEFSLRPSTYATMCLREILKSSTKTAQQATLNNLSAGQNKDTPVAATPSAMDVVAAEEAVKSEASNVDPSPTDPATMQVEPAATSVSTGETVASGPENAVNDSAAETNPIPAEQANPTPAE